MVRHPVTQYRSDASPRSARRNFDRTSGKVLSSRAAPRMQREFLASLPHNRETERVQPGSWESGIFFSSAPRFLSIRSSGCAADVNATIRPGYVRDSLSVSEPPPPDGSVALFRAISRAPLRRVYHIVSPAGIRYLEPVTFAFVPRQLPFSVTAASNSPPPIVQSRGLRGRFRGTAEFARSGPIC